MAAEAKIQRDICHYLEKQGHLFWRFSPETYNAKIGRHIKHRFIPNGLPDIMLIHPERGFIGIEVKGPKGKASAAQVVMQRRFNHTNAEYHVVKSVDEVVSVGL